MPHRDDDPTPDDWREALLAALVLTVLLVTLFLAMALAEPAHSSGPMALAAPPTS